MSWHIRKNQEKENRNDFDLGHVYKLHIHFKKLQSILIIYLRLRERNNYTVFCFERVQRVILYNSVSLSFQDLHRTGCSSYCGQEAEQDRVVLKRVLLAYARWNKNVGYCQGFNILAALILEVVEGNEGDALKVSVRL